MWLGLISKKIFYIKRPIHHIVSNNFCLTQYHLRELYGALNTWYSQGKNSHYLNFRTTPVRKLSIEHFPNDEVKQVAASEEKINLRDLGEFKSRSVLESISDIKAESSATHKPKNIRFQVIEFTEDGSIVELIKSTEDLNLQPRDISLFTADPRFSKQRAIIAARDMFIIFQTEACTAIVYPHKVTVLPLKRHKDTIKLVELVASRIFHGSLSIPFEFRVLEALLESTTFYFERKVKRVRLLLESVLADINTMKKSEIDISEFQRLYPIRRTMTEMLFDVREAKQAITDVVDNHEMLSSICLTEHLHKGKSNGITSHMKLASALFDGYERQIETIEGVLKEMENNLDDAREVWHMQMDSIRNRTIRINLMMSIASFSLLFSTVPASFFGMNIINGWEQRPEMFPVVVSSCVSGSISSYLLVYGMYRLWPARRHNQRVRDMQALKDILIHRIDDLDELFKALHKTEFASKSTFARVVRETLPDSPLSDGEINLLRRVFHSNREGLLEAGKDIISQDKKL